MPTINRQSPTPLGPNFLGETFNIKIAVAGTADHNGVFASLLNPLGETLVILNAVLYVSTASTGACTVDIGVAADATTSNDTLIDGLSTAATGSFGGAVSGGTNGVNVKTWGATSYVNCADASGDPTGLIGSIILTCIRP